MNRRTFLNKRAYDKNIRVLRLHIFALWLFTAICFAVRIVFNF